MKWGAVGHLKCSISKLQSFSLKRGVLCSTSDTLVLERETPRCLALRTSMSRKTTELEGTKNLLLKGWCTDSHTPELSTKGTTLKITQTLCEGDPLTHFEVFASEAGNYWDFLWLWWHLQVPFLQSHPTLLMLTLTGAILEQCARAGGSAHREPRPLLQLQTHMGLRRGCPLKAQLS